MLYATERQIEKLDILAVKYGLQIQQMMELAGYHMLEVFKVLKIQKSKKVVIVVGKGNKGGDGLCEARHLINRGYGVQVVLLSSTMSEAALHQLKLLRKMKANIILYSHNKKRVAQLINKSDILIDSLIGYHLKGAPRGLFKEVIEMMNASKKKIIAYDIPSGMEATSGKCYEPCIKAWATLTLAVPKKAFKNKKAKVSVGKLFLGDIGIPKFLYDKIKKRSKPDFKNKLILI